MEKNKVYVVEKGYYSDRGVVYVATTREGANSYVALMGRFTNPDEYSVTEYPLDEAVHTEKANVYCVEFTENDEINKVTEVPNRNEYDDYDDSYWMREEATNTNNYRIKHYSWSRKLDDLYVIAATMDEAYKIASDKLAEYKYRKDVELA